LLTSLVEEIGKERVRKLETSAASTDGRRLEGRAAKLAVP
jgi:hypothetical protein